MSIEIKVIGCMDHTIDNTLECNNRVYSQYGLSPTLNAMTGGNRQPMIVAMRGRNKDNPSDRTPGIELEQRLEIQHEGICNTLTSVQKDNMVLEAKLLGGFGEKKSNGGTQYYQQDRVYSSDGVAMCQPANIPGGSYNYLIKERTNMTGFNADNGVVEETKIEKVGQISSDGSQYGTVINDNGLSSTLSAGTHGYANNCIYSEYRIRKLTPKECWRLMGFTDEEFEKAAAVNSNTQLYKQAGNSIVVNVLEAIFRELIF